MTAFTTVRVPISVPVALTFDVLPVANLDMTTGTEAFGLMSSEPTAQLVLMHLPSVPWIKK